MARGDQMERQWRILQFILSSHRGKTVRELEDYFEYHPRTIYRDLEALQLAGFPVYPEREDGVNRWKAAGKGKTLLLPLPLTLPELMALYFSRDLLKFFRDTVFFDSLDSLFEKIRATLPPESVAFLGKVQETLFASLKPFKSYGRHRKTIEILQKAAIEKRAVRMDYYTMSRLDETKRTVDPYRICFLNDAFYLIGFCHLRKDVRTFSLDRISNIETTGATFVIPGDFCLEDFRKASFGVHHGEEVKRVIIRFNPRAAGYIRERTWHESQAITNGEDGSLVLEMEVAGTSEVKYWVRSWGGHAEVLEPPELREEVAAELRETLALYRPAMDHS